MHAPDISRRHLPLLAALGGGRWQLGLLHWGGFEVLPPQQERHVTQIPEVLPGHVVGDFGPRVGEDEPVIRFEVDLGLFEHDVLAFDQEVVADRVVGRCRGLRRRVGHDGCPPHLLGVVDQELIGGVLDEVDVAVGAFLLLGVVVDFVVLRKFDFILWGWKLLFKWTWGYVQADVFDDVDECMCIDLILVVILALLRPTRSNTPGGRCLGSIPGHL